MATRLSFYTSTFLCPPSVSLQKPPSKPCSNFHPCSASQKQRRRASGALSIRAEAVTIPVITFDGEKAGTASLDVKTARRETARAVVHRGVITELQNRRRGTASTLTRGEVRGGGRKPYRQKGTGFARRGSQRTPLRPGGGITFGPKPKDWSIKINKKEKRLAISTALSSAAVDSVVVDGFEDKFDTPKTKYFVAALKKWGVEPSKDHSLIFTTELSDNVRLSSRNIGTLKILTPRSLNLYDILRADKLIFTKGGVEYLNKTYGLNSAVGEEDEDEGEEEESSGSGNFINTFKLLLTMRVSGSSSLHFKWTRRIWMGLTCVMRGWSPARTLGTSYMITYKISRQLREEGRGLETPETAQ